VRWWNVKHPTAYAARLDAGQSPAHAREVLSDEQRLTERILLGVRLEEGLPVAELPDRTRVAELIADGLVDPAAALRGVVRLSVRGRLLADTVVRTLTSSTTAAKVGSA
jgi:oxygen-independent coproporphyrinogen-3 oxidase